MALLRVTNPGDEGFIQLGLEYELGESTTIGRSESTDFQLEDSRISRRQCRIEEAYGQYTIVDLESTNGTLVNNAKVIMAILKDQDRIRLDTVELLFVNPPAHTSDSVEQASETLGGKEQSEETES